MKTNCFGGYLCSFSPLWNNFNSLEVNYVHASLAGECPSGLFNSFFKWASIFNIYIDGEGFVLSLASSALNH